MSVNLGFQKVIGDFDRLTVTSLEGSDWLSIDRVVGFTPEHETVTLRSTEAVRDLYYALGRYLTLVDEAKP